MAGRIPQRFIDELLERVDIVDVIDARVPLRKAGKNYSARCPFHDEKSPSFNVNPDRQFYYCFGCGAGGNAIGFVMEFERLEFPAAVEKLAALAGLEVPREDGGAPAGVSTRQAELLKRLPIECEISFVKVASYHGTRSTGTVSQLIGLNEKIEGRHVVVLEDIVDTGHTIRHIMDILAERHPASISIATLLFKPDAYKQDIAIDHVALRIPNAFVVGSGLDHDGLGRNLPGIFKIVEG